MNDRRWNENVQLYPADRWFAWVERLIPQAVRPNHLTVVRMLLTPFVAYFLHQGDYPVGMTLFVIASATDWLDGLLARTRRQITEWGIVFDPIADKLLVGAALFIIVFEHVNVLLGLALLAIEIAALVAGIVRHSRGIVRPSNSWGKAKMIFEFLGITSLLAALWLGHDLLVDISVATLSFALIAALASVYWRIR